MSEDRLDDGVPVTCLLLGEAHGSYGQVHAESVGDRTAAAISVGSDADSPSLQFKADLETPNEDALCVIETPTWAGFAVADAHFGPESSHVLLTRLDAIWSKIQPTDIDHLGQMIEFLRNGDPPQTTSETTLLVVYYDRVARTGYGVSFGDSTFMIAGPDRTPLPVNERDFRYVSTADRGSLRNGLPFRFEAQPGELLLAFTDGVNECHYREPATSVNLDDIADTAAYLSYDPRSSVEAIAQLALDGVRGNPGGEDNLAIIAARP